MGLMRDRESEMPLLQQLVSLAKDPVRRMDISVDLWPQAMIGYALSMSEDPMLPEEGQGVYADYVKCVGAGARARALSTLKNFIHSNRGKGWQTLILYALCEDKLGDAALCREAARLLVLNAIPTPESPFRGVDAVVELLSGYEWTSSSMLGVVLGLGDMRLLPRLKPLFSLPGHRLVQLINGLDTVMTSLCSEWLLQLLEHAPDKVADAVADFFERKAAETSLVPDVVMPMPTWAFERAVPEPLHVWERSEYFARVQARLRNHLSPQRFARLQDLYMA